MAYLPSSAPRILRFEPPPEALAPEHQENHCALIMRSELLDRAGKAGKTVENQRTPH